MDNAFSDNLMQFSTAPYLKWGIQTSMIQASYPQKTYIRTSLSKTVTNLIKEEFKSLSSKPIVKEIMCGLLKLKKEEISQVVNEMLAI